MAKAKTARTYARASTAPPTTAVANASVGWGAGGPLWLDDFRSKRAPTPSELVNAYKAVAYACVSLNAKGVARVPLRLYASTRPGQARPGRGLRAISRTIRNSRQQYLRSLSHVQQVVQGEAEIEEITEHPYLQALARPNPYFDGALLMTYLATSLDVVGSAYLFPVRPATDFAASEFWPLHAQYVFPVKSTGMGGMILSHYTFMGSRLEPEDVIRFRHVSLRDPYLSGYAPLQACFEQVGLVNYYTATVENLLKNGARPSGVLTPTDPNMPGGDVETRRLQIEINRGFSGGNAGQVMVTQGAYQFVPFDYKPTDLGGLELTKFQRLTVANCFDVPISLLDTENSNRAVAEAAAYQHQRNAIEPRCVQIAGAMTAHAQQVDDRLFFAFDNPVEEDAERRAKLVDMGIRNGTVTVNEARRESGDGDVDGGDEPLLAGTFVRLRDVAADPEPVPTALTPGQPPANADDEGSDDAEPDDEAAEVEAETKPAEATTSAEDDKAERLFQAERLVAQETLALLREMRAMMAPDVRSVRDFEPEPAPEPETEPDPEPTPDPETPQA
jgi:HK97 family phage portal protein